jgi:hypothetical protein
VDPLAFLVGPVEDVYGSDPAKTRVADLARSIDPKARVVRSNTGQLSWDYGRGLCTVNAPTAQGATGFLKRVGPVALGDMTINSENDYATILAVSLDGRPLAQSDRILIQAGTRARPTGWADHEATFKADDGKQTIHGRQIDSTGTMPWAVARTRATIQVRNPKLIKAVPLDVNGNPRGKMLVRRAGGALELKLPEDALYVVLLAR